MKIRDKQPLTSYDELKKVIISFKRSSRKFFSNYVPNPSLHKKWINNDKTYLYIFDSTVFIAHDKGFMAELIFVSKDINCLSLYLKSIHKDLCKPIVLERVIRENKDISLGTPNYVLRRMSRSGMYKTTPKDFEHIVSASVEDIPEISEIFSKYFNPLTERIPDSTELSELIKDGGISIFRYNHSIKGMIIYEKDISNMHLRYWWVSPENRNMGIGSELMNEYFFAGKDTKRNFLWVFSDNVNAISKYKHYGFSFDGIADEIYIYT